VAEAQIVSPAAATDDTGKKDDDDEDMGVKEGADEAQAVDV